MIKDRTPDEEKEEARAVCNNLLVDITGYDKDEAQRAWDKTVSNNPKASVRDRIISLLESEVKDQWDAYNTQNAKE